MSPPEEDLFWLFIEPFEQYQFRYMISGSVASIYYGEPRMTADIDVAVFLNRSQVSMLDSLFSSEFYYLPPAEVITLEQKRQQREHFNRIHSFTGMKADIYLSRSHLLYRWAWGKRIRGSLVRLTRVCDSMEIRIFSRRRQ